MSRVFEQRSGDGRAALCNVLLRPWTLRADWDCLAVPHLSKLCRVWDCAEGKDKAKTAPLRPCVAEDAALQQIATELQAWRWYCHEWSAEEPDKLTKEYGHGMLRTGPGRGSFLGQQATKSVVDRMCREMFR